MSMHWHIKKADRYGNSDTKYYINIGGKPAVDTCGAHCSITKNNGKYIAKIAFTDMTVSPWESHTKTNTFATLNETKQWCEEVYINLRSTLKT